MIHTKLGMDIPEPSNLFAAGTTGLPEEASSAAEMAVVKGTAAGAAQNTGESHSELQVFPTLPCMPDRSCSYPGQQCTSAYVPAQGPLLH